MKALTARGRGSARDTALTIAMVAVAVFVIVEVTTSNKVSFYVDALVRSKLLYALPFAAIGGLLVVLRYPQLPIYLLAFLIPFNFVGGYWGSDLVVLLAKMSMNVLAAAALVATFLVAPADREWLTRTRLGHAVLAWLGAVVMGVVVGFVSAPNHEYWVRESGWMLFFTAALPFGTLIQDRRDIARLIASTCAGVAVLQAYGFWMVATGTRFARIDAWEGGQSFFRAPYSCVSLFALYLAAAALLYGSAAKVLSRRAQLALFAIVALLGGGLLASMVRSLWISGAFGLLVVLLMVPWDRRTARAAAAVTVGAILAIAVVAIVDRLSPASSGHWLASAVTFLMDLVSSESTSRMTRELEWWHAIDVWKRSPIVGLGFGYAFPPITIVAIPDAAIPDLFFMHNSYFNILAKVGAIGLTAFVYLLWRTFHAARDMVRREDVGLHDRILATAVVAAILSLALLTATMPVLTAGDSAAYLGMLVGITVAMRRAHFRERA